MHLLVETNFLLEQVFGQEQAEACERLMQAAAQGRITLHMPAFGLMEALYRLTGLDKRRTKLLARVEKELSQAERNPDEWEAVQENRRTFTTDLNERQARQQVRLLSRGQQLAESAQLIPLTETTWRRATELFDTAGLTLPDAMVCASVLLRIEELATSEPTLFVTRDRKGFRQERVRQLFEAQGCEVLFHFDHACARLRL